MRKIPLCLLFVFLFFEAFSQSGDELEVRKVLDGQVNSWNRGNIEDFMKSYWQNDSLIFIGHGGITYGYKNTLNNYKKNYDDTTKMGKLSFDLLQVKRLSSEYYFVIGNWLLKRSIGNIGGTFSLLFMKTKSGWVIITDHTS
ncbi:MAG TPA: hypothetical protein VMI12_02545 [Puia sp.]|nr:hypothetical protein [Puia sp.]